MIRAKSKSQMRRLNTQLVPIGSLDRPNPNCATCGGEGWVCENHPSLAWGSGERCCGGAGMPCQCSPLSKAGKVDSSD